LKEVNLIKPKGTYKSYAPIIGYEGNKLKYDSVKFVINASTEYEPFQEGYSIEKITNELR
jgi:hypothetical protein